MIKQVINNMEFRQHKISSTEKPGFSSSLQEPQKISTQVWDDHIKPVVSICCITYAHGDFIQDAIEGFLMQETTFPVEILIHDDASPDQTPDIISRYESNYPDLIRAVYQENNQYSKGVNPFEDLLFPMARGSYIALCEGDDYWTDPHKLQKQVEFLEHNPEFSTCVGGYTRQWGTSPTKEKVIVQQGAFENQDGFEFTLQEMQQAWLTKTLTAVFRKNVLDEIDLSVYRYGRDIHLFYHLVKNHKAFYLHENLGVYRVHKGGVNSMKQGKVNKNAAYNCYRELYLHNKDEFTRKMYLKSILSLLNFNLFNRYVGNTLAKNLRFFAEAISMIRASYEIKMLFMIFFKREWKDKIKNIIK